MANLIFLIESNDLKVIDKIGIVYKSAKNVVYYRHLNLNKLYQR